MYSYARIDVDSFIVKFSEDDGPLVCELKVFELLEHIFPDVPHKIVRVIVTKEYEEITDEFQF